VKYVEKELEINIFDKEEEIALVDDLV